MQRTHWEGVPLLDAAYFDSLDIEKRIQAIDPSFRLRVKKGTGEAVVFQVIDDREELVGVYPKADERIVHRLMEIVWGDERDPNRLGKELDAIDTAQRKEAQHQKHEQTGEIAQELAGPVRKLYGIKDRAFIP